MRGVLKGFHPEAIFPIPGERPILRLFRRFYIFPAFQHLSGCFQIRIAENVRVAPDHLFVGPVNDIGKTELPLLPGDLRVKDYLEEQVSQLLP